MTNHANFMVTVCTSGIFNKIEQYVNPERYHDTVSVLTSNHKRYNASKVIYEQYRLNLG